MDIANVKPQKPRIMSEIKLYTKEELSKAGDTVLNEAQLKHLLSKTPANHIYKRPAKGGGEWTYVTGMYVKKTLNFMFGWDWDFTVVNFDVNIQAKQVIVQGRLKVRSNNREIVKDQFGRQDIKFKKDTEQPLDLGNDIKGATTDALKKCASELGVASDVYAPNEFKEINVKQPGESEMSEFETKRQEVIEAISQIQDKETGKYYSDMLAEKQNNKELTIELMNNVLKEINNETS